MTILRVKKLVKKFAGVSAIDGLSIEVKRGTITAVIGPNGSGKTTLVNVLSGIAPMDGGSIVLNDAIELKKIRPCDASSYGITRTFQGVRLFEQMTALDNVLVALTERNVFSALFERHGAYHLTQAEQVLTRVGLWEKRGELAASLSYGQRKLLEIARVLALCETGQAHLVLLDEPFAGLFPHMVRTLSEIVMEMKQAGRTVILIEHNMDIIRRLSDHVIVMDSGALLAQGPPAEVLARKEVIEAYLGV